MKHTKFPLASAFIILISILLVGAGCINMDQQGSKTANQTVDTKYFSVEIPDGWLYNDVNGDGEFYLIDPEHVGTSQYGQHNAAFSANVVFNELNESVERYKATLQAEGIISITDYSTDGGLSGLEILAYTHMPHEHERSYLLLELNDTETLILSANIDKYNNEYYNFVNSISL